MNPRKKIQPDKKPNRNENPRSVHRPSVRKKTGEQSKPSLKGKNQSETAGTLPGIPPVLEDLISAYIKEKTGKEPDDPVLLSRLRQAVMAQKAMYWKEKPGKNVKYGRGYDILAYLAYHLPVYFTQFRSIAQDLFNEDILPESVSILDIGTGPGVVPLAMIDLWRSVGRGELQIYAVERSEEHAEAFNSLVSGYKGSDSEIKVNPVILEDLTVCADRLALPEKVTLITFQNVLAELEHLSLKKRADIVLSYAKSLDEAGFLIIVEPAELRHATSLRMLQLELMKSGLYVYAPCTYFWGSRCDPSSCWTFREEDPIRPTRLMNLLAGDDEGYRFINTDVKYAYLILTRKPVSRCTYRVPRKNRFTRLSQLDHLQGRVISVTAARMSEDIGTRGMHIFKMCDGSCREPVYLVLSSRNRRPGHSVLFQCSYGEPLIISGVQVKRHQKHSAWNLVVSADTRIERAVSVAPPLSKPDPAHESVEKTILYQDGDENRK